MSPLVVYRVDRRLVPLHDRPEFSAVVERLSDTLFTAAAIRGEGVAVLDTCERYEVYCSDASAAVDALTRAARLPGDVMRIAGAEATRHLFRVAAGLESSIVGESHILGQLRAALEMARLRGTACDDISRAFVGALACGRRVRARVSFGDAAAGHAARAVARLRADLSDLPTRRVLVVGSGALAADVAVALRREGVSQLVIAGRHERRVSELAARCQARALLLGALDEARVAFDAIVTAVSTARPVLSVESVRACRASHVIDLGASPNVDPAVGALSSVCLVGLHDLGGGEVLASVLTRATGVVERELARFHASIACARLRVAS